MIDALILTVTGQDGHTRQITLSPVINDGEHNNVYSVYEGEVWGGDFAFDEDHENWEYIGDLPYHEQLQIVEALYYHLQSREISFPSDMQPLTLNDDDAAFPNGMNPDGFTFDAYSEGKMVNIEIVPNEGSFGVLIDGQLAGEVELSDDGYIWEVSNGDIDDALVPVIGEKIKSRYM